MLLPKCSCSKHDGLKTRRKLFRKILLIQSEQRTLFFWKSLGGRYKAHNTFWHFHLKKQRQTINTIKKQLYNLNKAFLFSCSLKREVLTVTIQEPTEEDTLIRLDKHEQQQRSNMKPAHVSATESYFYHLWFILSNEAQLWEAEISIKWEKSFINTTIIFFLLLELPICF